jgi:hypothetical protein
MKHATNVVPGAHNVLTANICKRLFWHVMDTDGNLSKLMHVSKSTTLAAMSQGACSVEDGMP